MIEYNFFKPDHNCIMEFTNMAPYAAIQEICQAVSSLNCRAEFKCCILNLNVMVSEHVLHENKFSSTYLDNFYCVAELKAKV